MYIYTCICIRVYIWTCLFTNKWPVINLALLVELVLVETCVYIYFYIYVYLHIWIYEHVHSCDLGAAGRVHIGADAYVHIYTCTYICTHVYMYIYIICICIYTWTHEQWWAWRCWWVSYWCWPKNSTHTLSGKQFAPRPFMKMGVFRCFTWNTNSIFQMNIHLVDWNLPGKSWNFIHILFGNDLLWHLS